MNKNHFQHERNPAVSRRLQAIIEAAEIAWQIDGKPHHVTYYRHMNKSKGLLKRVLATLVELGDRSGQATDQVLKEMGL